MQTKNTSHILGIDVSKWQGEIDWKKVKAAGIKYAFIKSSEGRTGLDAYMRRNAAACEGHGIPFGFYHFARPDNSPQAEAEHFAEAVKGLKPQLPHVLDLEVTGALNGVELTTWAARWMAAVEKLTGHSVMIYTGGSFARKLGAQLKQYPLWVAHYGVQTPMANPTWSSWSVFQYTSEGKVDGIKGNVDMNVMEPAFFKKYTAEPVPVVYTLFLAPHTWKVTPDGNIYKDNRYIEVNSNTIKYIPAAVIEASRKAKGAQ